MSVASRAAVLLVALAGLAAATCSRPAPPAPPPAAVPTPATIDATVITLRVVSQPGSETTRHELLVANGKVRSTDEIDRWRLFDTRDDTVTYVDDITRTFRRETRQDLLDRYARELAAAPRMPAAAVVEHEEVTRTVDGYAARGLGIRLGAFERELWITGGLPIDPTFFSLYSDAEPLDPDGIRAMRAAITALDRVRGFPVVDHVRFDSGERSIDVETTVESVGTRSISAARLRVPNGYREITESPAGPRSSSSPRSDRSTPKEESRPSAKGRNTP